MDDCGLLGLVVPPTRRRVVTGREGGGRSTGCVLLALTLRHAGESCSGGRRVGRRAATPSPDGDRLPPCRKQACKPQLAQAELRGLPLN